MSRVERNRDQYSREDRAALDMKDAGRPAEAEEPRTSGRAARNNDPHAGESFGILDMTEEEKTRYRKEARAMRDGRPRVHAGRVLGRLISAAGTILLVLAIVACLGLSIPRLAGIDQYVVVSGSMEPAIPVGSMVYSAQTEPSTLEPGDVIVFTGSEMGGTPVTHRVVENHIADGEVITKGDANEQNDLSPVMYANISGKMVLHVPMLGFIAAPMASKAGKAAMALVIVGAYLLTVLGSRLSRK